MKDEIKEILDKFDKVLENYELDKKFGQMSVDSICHLFPSEMIIIKDYITNLQEENKKLEREIKIKDAWANEIKLNLWGYDGCENSIHGLRGLVDEAIDKSKKIMNCDDKSIVWSGSRHDEHGNKYVEHKNVLLETLTEFTEEDQKLINSEEYKRFWFRGENNEDR